MILSSVIPAKAGIQAPQVVKTGMPNQKEEPPEETAEETEQFELLKERMTRTS